MTYFDGHWDNGVLAKSVRYQSEEFPEGTRVTFRPYPADEGYAEIMLPTGVLVTETYDRVEIEE